MDAGGDNRHYFDVIFYHCSGFAILTTLPVSPLRKYQLDIIFLFFSLLAIIWSIFYLLQYLGADAHRYEWQAAGPLIIIYAAALWQIRAKIRLDEHRKLTGYTLFYWIILGITLLFSYSSPLPAASYYPVELLFVIFTLYLADSYWDFRKLTLKNLLSRKNRL